jgi:hypothetical protein
VAAVGEVLFKLHEDGGHVGESAPAWRDCVWLGFNSRTHAHIVSDEGEIVHRRTIHRKQPENMWNTQLVLDINCTPWNLEGRDAVMDLEVAMGRGVIGMKESSVRATPTVARECLGLIGKRVYIT